MQSPLLSPKSDCKLASQQAVACAHDRNLQLSYERAEHSGVHYFRMFRSEYFERAKQKQKHCHVSLSQTECSVDVKRSISGPERKGCCVGCRLGRVSVGKRSGQE